MGNNYGLSDNAITIFKNLYSFQNESIENTFKRVSKEFSTNDDEEGLAFSLLADGVWRPNTPVFLNAGTEHKNFCACHVVGLEDSMESIYDVANVSRKIFQYGAGVGIPIGNLREKEAFIFEGRPEDVPEGKSSGPIVFMRLYDAVGDTTKSGGRVRRAAIMVSMYCWHPDILDFVQCKQNEGWLTNMNISVAITDKFMQCLDDNIPFKLYTPYDGAERGTIDPQELWETIAVMAHKTGDPGVLFLDRVQEFNPLKKSFLIESTNPCVTGETLVSTPFGYRRADSFSIGETIDTVCGTSEIKKIEINNNLPVYEIEFSDGGFIEVTESHQFHAMKRGKGKEATKKWIPIQLKELEIGDWVRVHPTSLPEFPVKFNSYGLNDYEYGFLVGICIGDGCITEKSQDKKRIKITSNSDDKNWINILEEFLHKVGYTGSNEKHPTNKSFNLIINGESILLNILKELNLKGIANYKRIPRELYRTNREVLKGILDGLFCTDGNVNLSSTHPTLRYSSASRKLIADIRDILLMFGIHCSMGITKKGRTHFYEKEKREIKGNPKYECIVSGASLRKFYDEIHLTRPYKRDRLFKAVKDFSLTGNTWKAKILSIKEKGLANVYDLYEPETDTWITNGYVSRGCGEQPLMPWGVCNLSAINVAKFVSGDDEYNWDDLYKVAYNITRLMDNIIDTMDYPDPRFKDTAQKYRQIGVGIMGLADAMYMLNYRYDGPEGKKFAAEVMRTITTASVDCSADLAVEKGAFHNYEEFKEDLLSILSKQINNRKVLKKVRANGVRNSQFTTCQPTGTTALSCDCSYGIEPIFGLVFEKNLTDGGKMKVVNSIFMDRVKNESWWNDSFIEKIYENGGSLKGIHGIPREIREVFITAHDIKPKDRIDIQAHIQKHCSTAISSTVNLQKDTTATEIADLYKYAWRKGLKGLTVYRDGSKANQPVTFRKEEDNGEVLFLEALRNLKIQRPKRLSGETHTVETGDGKMYVTVNSTDRKPIELFVEVGKSGQSTKVMSEALGRVVSIALQHRVPVEEIIKTLKGLDSSNPVWYRFEEDDTRPIQVLSIPDGVAQLLERYYINTIRYDDIEFLNGSTLSTCKKCNNRSYLMSEGCGVCQNCGYSHCS